MKEKLVNHFGDAIVILNQRGQAKSSIVLSNKISLLDAIVAANSLKQEFRKSQLDDLQLLAVDDANGDSHDDKYATLHAAVGIIRKAMADIPVKAEYYHCSNEVDQNSSERYFPTELVVAMQWLIDEKALESADPNHTPTDENRRRYIML